MSFQAPITIEEVLEGVHHKRYLLPAIQREFVKVSRRFFRLLPMPPYSGD